MKFAQIGFKALFFCATLAYPFFYNYTEMLCCVGVLWFLRAFLQKEFFSFFIGAFFVLLLFAKSEILSLLYPSLMSFIFGGIFLLSLKTVPFITRLALLREKNLPQRAIDYTRKLSAFWAWFLLINGVFALFLAIYNVKWWQFWCSVGFYLCIGFLFVGEFLWRKLIMQRYVYE